MSGSGGIADTELDRVERAVAESADGVSSDILDRLDPPVSRRTLQSRLSTLVASGRVLRTGAGRATRYRVRRASRLESSSPSHSPVLSPDVVEVLERIRRPLATRRPVGHDPSRLDDYVPNETRWLRESDLERLRALGPDDRSRQPAGTYARHILDRLMIDLSWNSSRLEGNTYSRLDTRRLIAFGAEASGKARLDTQMILNHKAAIEFLVDGADVLELDPLAVRNLHALLADSLMSDVDAPGRLRRMPVDIGGSVFLPLAIPQAIEAGFERLLEKARAIEEPHERSLFVLAQVPYLQPFDDVNKRTARLAANLPLIRANLVPLSFVDVSEPLYVEAILAFYELGDIRPLRALFVFACERSAQRYAAVRQSLGEPDPFRLRHRRSLGEVVGEVVREGLERRAAWERLRRFADERLERVDREPFVEMVESELLGLHEGNFARYRVRASEFAAWSETWREGR